MCNCTTQDDFSSSNIQQNGCPFTIPGTCSFYSGLAISSMGINPGDTFDSVVRKIAIYLGAINGSITELQQDVAVLSGDTTSSTTTTSTTASSTSTTTTTAGTGSTTTTTSTTSSGISSLVYVGNNDTGTAPNSSAILAGISSTQDETANVLANWTSFNSAPHYLWFAIKVNGTNSNKNSWYESAGNNGSIGTGDDLFGALTTVSVSGTPYYVGITNYVTQFTGTVLLKHV